MSLAALARRVDHIEFVVAPPPDDGERPLKLFAVFISTMGETFWDWDPLEGSRWDDHLCYGAEHLDKLEAEGFDVIVCFDPERCDHAKLVTCSFLSTPEGSEARAAEEKAHADVFPELKEENLYMWRDAKPGQFIELIEQKRGANSQGG